MNYWYTQQHDESQKHYANWKKSAPKDYTVNTYSIYMKFYKNQNYSGKASQWFLGDRTGGRDWGQGTQGNFEGD